MFAQRIIVMQPDETRIDSTFLKYMLLSQPVQRRIRERATGATVSGIKASLLKQILIQFPRSLDEQLQIVAKLDGLTDETRRLESVYERTLLALDALKRSLVYHAMSGQLTG